MPLVSTIDSETVGLSEVLASSTSMSTQRRGLRREGDACLPIMFVEQVLKQVKILASYYPGRGQSKHPLAAFPTVSPTIVQSLNLANGNDLSVENMNTQASLPAIDTNTSKDDMTLIFIPGQGDAGECL